MTIQEAIARVIERKNLTENEMTDVMGQIMSGETTDAQIGAFLIGLRMKGETVEEIGGAVRVMRQKATPVDAGSLSAVDTCGTGGDGASTFNISTTAAFVVAAAGLKVAKHGNRAISSRSGSADVLKALGVNVEADVGRVEKCLADVGVGFLFAPLMHGAMKHAIGPRREIGARTLFNILGPLTNPAGATGQVVGVYDKTLTAPLAQVLANLGSRRVFVVHGADGLDELTVTGASYVAEWNRNEGGEVQNYEGTPEEFGLGRWEMADLAGGEAEENAAITRAVLGGEKGARRDIVLFNAGAAICAGGEAEDIATGIDKARVAIDSGAALKKLDALVTVSSA